MIEETIGVTHWCYSLSHASAVTRKCFATITSSFLSLFEPDVWPFLLCFESIKLSIFYGICKRWGSSSFKDFVAHFRAYLENAGHYQCQINIVEMLFRLTSERQMNDLLGTWYKGGEIEKDLCSVAWYTSAQYWMHQTFVERIKTNPFSLHPLAEYPLSAGENQDWRVLISRGLESTPPTPTTRSIISLLFFLKFFYLKAGFRLSYCLSMLFPTLSQFILKFWTFSIYLIS